MDSGPVSAIGGGANPCEGSVSRSAGGAAPAATKRMSAEAAPLPLRIIEPRSGWDAVEWREFWEYRELLGFLIWRDVKVRYKQTVLGAAWAVLQPLATMAVFTVLFGRWAKMPSDGVPYPVFAFAALVPWTFFSNAVSGAANSLVGNTHLVSKVYFPRLLITASSIAASLLDMAVALAAMVVLLAVYGIGLTWQVVALPFAILVTLLCALGAGAALAAMCAVYRDVRYVVPLLLQLWMFATPVIYPVSLVPAEWRWLFYLNPLAGAVETFRAALTGLPLPWAPLACSLLISLALGWLGVAGFRRIESRVADLL
jgi:lipopolysaccharide transport system permease protein